MSHQRIAASILAGSAALALAGCQQEKAVRNQAAPDNTAAGKSVLGAATPSPTPSPRSIMQPDVVHEPIAPPPPMPIEATIGFPEGGAKLDDAARQQLDTLVADPVTASGGPIVLRGNTDSRGSDADNKAASKKRAEAVGAYLEKKGVAKERITIIALGEDRPVAPNANADGSDNPEGRAKNRRVEISVTPGEQPDAAPAPAPSPSATAQGAKVEGDQRQLP
jgi:OOP family OmpA-OmpF porin